MQTSEMITANLRQTSLPLYLEIDFERNALLGFVAGGRLLGDAFCVDAARQLNAPDAGPFVHPASVGMQWLCIL